MPSLEPVQSPAPPIGFDADVPPSGYRWWYLDGLSEDGRYGFVVIAFVGSVFSPYYFRARQRGPTDAEDFCSINVCLYKPGGDRWAMTEHSRRALARGQGWFQVANSRLEWRDGALEVDVDERTAPFRRRLRGHIRLQPKVLNDRRFELDTGGRHGWQPVAPVAAVELCFEHPRIEFEGHAYLDSNDGSRMLELDFDNWHWSRSSDARSTTLYYVAEDTDRRSRALALRFSEQSGCETLELPREQALRHSGWHIGRVALDTEELSIVRALEDTPFYARTLLRAGGPASRLCVHESLDMQRFQKAWVRSLLPFRMPRRR